MSNFTINTQDALKILGLTGDITPLIVKKAYKIACSKFHPDRNPAGLEMMKSVNISYEALKDFSGSVDIDDSVIDYGDDLNAAINAIIDCGLEIEICGAWIWVSGNTRDHKNTLKSAGFKWASKKKRWYFRPNDYKSRSRGKFSMNDIREKYNSSSANRNLAGIA